MSWKQIFKPLERAKFEESNDYRAYGGKQESNKRRRSIDDNPLQSKRRKLETLFVRCEQGGDASTFSFRKRKTDQTSEITKLLKTFQL